MILKTDLEGFLHMNCKWYSCQTAGVFIYLMQQLHRWGHLLHELVTKGRNLHVSRDIILFRVREQVLSHGKSSCKPTKQHLAEAILDL